MRRTSSETTSARAAIRGHAIAILDMETGDNGRDHRNDTRLGSRRARIASTDTPDLGTFACGSGEVTGSAKSPRSAIRSRRAGRLIEQLECDHLGLRCEHVDRALARE